MSKMPGRPLMDSVAQTVAFNVSLADLNAGKTLVPPRATAQLRVTGLKLRVNGALAGATDMRVSDLAADGSAPNDLLTVTAANATDGARHSDLSGTNTLAAAFWSALPAGRGVQIRKTGATATGTTSVDVLVSFIFIEP